MIQIVPAQANAPKGRGKADIVQHRDGTLELLHEGKPLAIGVFKGLERAGARTVDDKTLNAHVDLLVSKAKRSKACSPMTRLAAQIAHEESQRKLGIYTPSHPSQLPKERARLWICGRCALRSRDKPWTTPARCPHLIPFDHKLNSLLQSIFKIQFNIPSAKRGHF